MTIIKNMGIKNIIFDFYGVLVNPADNSPIHETIDLMLELKDHGVRVFGMTNLETENLKMLIAKCPILRQLEDIICSGEVKASKPNPKIYQTLLERNKLTAEETLFIDDSIINVEGAMNLGLHAHHFVSPKQLENCLIDYGFFKNLPDQHDCCGSATCQHH